jgi:hypothetical protein
MPTMGRRRNDAASSVGWLEEWSSPRCKLWSAVRRRGAQSAADVGTFAAQRWENWQGWGEMAGMGRDGESMRSTDRVRIEEVSGVPLWPEDPAVVALETSLEMF